MSFIDKIFLSISIGKHQRKYFVDIYRGDYSGKKKLKTIQEVR